MLQRVLLVDTTRFGNSSTPFVLLEAICSKLWKAMWELHADDWLDSSWVDKDGSVMEGTQLIFSVGNEGQLSAEGKTCGVLCFS